MHGPQQRTRTKSGYRWRSLFSLFSNRGFSIMAIWFKYQSNDVNGNFSFGGEVENKWGTMAVCFWQRVTVWRVHEVLEVTAACLNTAGVLCVRPSVSGGAVFPHRFDKTKHFRWRMSDVLMDLRVLSTFSVCLSVFVFSLPSVLPDSIPNSLITLAASGDAGI